MINTLRYQPADQKYNALVMTSEIEHIYKSIDGERTFIRLRSGEILTTHDSINTIEDRLNPSA
jgi:hypothetical protein